MEGDAVTDMLSTTFGATVEQVVEMTLVTPGEGTLTVTAESDPELFHVARVRTEPSRVCWT